MTLREILVVIAINVVAGIICLVGLLWLARLL